MKHHLLGGALALSLALAGCQPAPLAAPAAATTASTTTSLTVRFDLGRDLLAYKRYTRADIDHVTLRIYRVDAGTEVLAGTVEVPAAALGDDLTLDALTRSTDYKLRADAYKAAGNAAADRISVPVAPAIPVTTTNTASVALTVKLPVHLARYTPTFGHADAGWVDGLGAAPAFTVDPNYIHFLDANGDVNQLMVGDTDAGNAYALGVGPFVDMCQWNGAIIAVSPDLGLCQASFDDGVAYPIVPDQRFVAVAASADGKLQAVTEDGALYTITSDVDAPWDGGSATLVAGATFQPPGAGMAFAPSGDLFVTSADGTMLQRLVPGGTVLPVGTALTGMADVVASADGDLFVTSTATDAVHRVALDGTTSVLAGDPGEAGGAAGFGTAAQFAAPGALAIGTDGTLFVADAGSGFLRRIF